jgi:hypothetical protein
MCQNLRLFDHFAPDLRLLLEESPRGLPTFNNGDEANSFFQTLMSLWNNVARFSGRFSAPHSQLQCRSLKLEILNIQAFRYPLRDEECR